MTCKEYRAKSSLQSGIEPLDSCFYISADSNLYRLYRGNQESPVSKQKFLTEPGNKSSEEWDETSEERFWSSEEFFVSSLDNPEYLRMNFPISSTFQISAIET